MQCIRRIQPEERSDIGRRHTERQVRVKVIVDVGSDAEDRLGCRLPQTEISRPKSLEVAVELAYRSSALARDADGDFFLCIQAICYTAHERVLRDLWFERQKGGCGSDGIADLRIPVGTANVRDDAQFRIQEVGSRHEERHFVVLLQRGAGLETEIPASSSDLEAMAVCLGNRPFNTGLAVGARLAAGTARCLRLYGNCSTGH